MESHHLLMFIRTEHCLKVRSESYRSNMFSTTWRAPDEVIWRRDEITNTGGLAWVPLLVYPWFYDFRRYTEYIQRSRFVIHAGPKRRPAIPIYWW